MKILGIIPARFASSRFPGKPLVDIGGKSMIQRVYEQAQKAPSLTSVAVATDDQRIYDHVLGFGGEVYMTSENHPSGTDRCYEAYQKAGGSSKFDYVINIQGDEPFIDPAIIEQMAVLLDSKTEIATAVKKIKDYNMLFDPNVVKAVLALGKQCLYFSRQTLPYVRGGAPESWLDHADFYKHIGLYAYRSDVLEKIALLQPSKLENTEKLEQLRWLEHGYKIFATITEYESIGVDTPEDLGKLKDFV